MFRTTLDYSAELWRQLIGVLGWLDTRLNPLAYPVLSGLLSSSSAGVTVGSDVTVRSGSRAGNEAAAYPARGGAGSSGGVAVGSVAIDRGSVAIDRGNDAVASIAMLCVASWITTGRAHSLASVPKRP